MTKFDEDATHKLREAFATAVMTPRQSMERRDAAWKELAQKYGLTADDKALFGMIDGIEVRVEERDSRDETTVSTVLDANFGHYHRTVPAGLNISAEGLFKKIKKLFGANDIQLDLPGIDRKLFVQAADEEEVRDWAQKPNVTAALKRLTSLRATWHLNDFELVVSHFDTRFTKAEEIEARLFNLVSIARGLLDISAE